MLLFVLSLSLLIVIRAEFENIFWLDDYYHSLSSNLEYDATYDLVVVELEAQRTECFSHEEFWNSFERSREIHEDYYFSLPYFHRNTSEHLFNDQNLFHFLLQKNFKINFECLTQLGSLENLSFEEELLFIMDCAVLRSMKWNEANSDKQTADLMILFLDDETCRTSTLESLPLYRIPSLQLKLVKEMIENSLGREITFTPSIKPISTPTGLDSSHLNLEAWISDYQHFSNAHVDGLCNLWWPLNFTDIIRDSADKQNLLLQCDLPSEITTELLFSPSSTFQLLFTINEYWQPDCESCYHSSRTAADVTNLINKNITPSFPSHGYTLLPLSGSIEMSFPPLPDHTHKRFAVQLHLKEIRRSEESSENIEEIREIGNFNILQNIINPHSSLNALRFPPNLNEEVIKDLSYKYSLLSFITTRESFGFLFSSLFNKQEGFSFVEIGVFQGQYAERLLNTSSLLSIYVGIDTWKPWSINDYVDTTNVQSLEYHEKNYQQTIDRMNRSSSIFPLALPTRKLLIREDASKAAHLFPDHSIDVVYIDAMHHYTAVVKDILTWYPKVKVGGIVAGHDFHLGLLDSTILSVRPAVEKFAREKNLVLFTTKEEMPSWILLKTHV